MSDKNMFGGGNAHSLYVPLSEVEQESIGRLVAAGDLQVHILGWGFVSSPRVTFGDARVQIQFRMNFDRPATPQPVHFFDLELRTSSGTLLFKQRQSTLYNNQPILVAAGMYLDLVWDIMISSIDPKLVKSVVPHAKGLTSRLQDKDTGDMTLLGNMRLDAMAQKTLRQIRQGEGIARALNERQRSLATKKSGQ